MLVAMVTMAYTLFPYNGKWLEVILNIFEQPKQ